MKIFCSLLFMSAGFLSIAQANDDVITVTATKRQQAAQSVPASVTVLSADQIELANTFNSAEDLVSLLSGVQAALANGTQVSFQIRGIGAVDHQALTPTAAAVYADGVFMATNVQTGLFLYDIERVEVLKGPQGSLYGRNASGGAINVFTHKPQATAKNYLTASYGNFDRFDVQSGYTRQLGEGLYGRIATRYLSQRPSLNNVITDTNHPIGPQSAAGTRDEFGVRLSLGFDRGGSTRWVARAHYEEDNGINPAPRNSALNVGDHDISIGPDGVQDTDNEFYGASFELKTRLAHWSVTSITSLEGYNQQYGFDFDGTQAPFGTASLNANLSYDRNFIQASEEIRLERSWANHHSMIGFVLAQENFDQDYWIWCGQLNPSTRLGSCRYVGAPGRAGPNPASQGTPTSLITQIEQDRLTAALFTYNEFKLSDRLALTIGGRFTYEDIEGSGSGRHIFDDGTIAFNNRGGLGPAKGQNTIYEDRFTGNLALKYDLSASDMIYVSYASGYKSGGFNGEVQNNATHFQDEGLFSAETVNAYELGYKGQWHSTLTLTTTAFFQDYQAPQARIFVNFPLPDRTSIISNSLSNLDEAVSYGLETELTWKPSEQLTLNASATRLETEIHQTRDTNGNASLFNGNPLPFASKASASVFGRYEKPLNENSSVSFTAHAKYRSAYYLDAEGREDRKQKGFVSLGAETTLNLDKRDLAISLWGRNLLNKDYAVSGFGFIGYNTFIGEPRTYGIRLNKTF